MSTYAVSLDFQDGSSYIDVTSKCLINTLRRDRKLYGQDFKCVQDTVGFDLLRNSGVMAKLLTNPGDILAKIEKDGDPWFQGFVRRNYSVAVKTQLQPVKIELIDRGEQLRKKVDLSFAWVGFKVHTAADTTHSILHQLLLLAGYDAGDITPDDIDITIPYYVNVSLDSDETYYDKIQKLLFEYGYVFYHDASGKFCTYNFLPASLSSTFTFRSGVSGIGNMVGELKIKKNLWKYEGAEIQWYLLETLTGATVFNDTTGGSAGLACSILLAPDDYYPDASESGNVYSEYRVDDREIVYCDTVNLTLTGGTGIHQEAFTNYYKKAVLSIHNSSGASAAITTLKITGTAVVKGDLNKERYSAVLDTSKLRKFTAQYISAKADAQKLAVGLSDYDKYSPFEYGLRSREEIAIGSIVTILDTETIGINNVVRISAITDWAQTGYHDYTMDGVSAYSGADTETEVLHRQPPAVQPAQVAGEISEVYSSIVTGFNQGGGTTVPTVPTILSIRPYFGMMAITVDRQTNLTNFERNELQTSIDDTNWYSLGIDSDWKGTLNEDTDFPGEVCQHFNIPYAGTNENPTGILLYYRARRVTKAPLASAWGASASATTQTIGGEDIASLGITASKLDAAARGNHGVFFESFEVFPSSWTLWATAPYTGTDSLVTGAGQCGGNVYQGVGTVGRSYTGYIPFDQNKVYRFRGVARRTSSGADADVQRFAFWVSTYDANKTYIDGIIACGWVDLKTCTLNAWQTYTGYYKGRKTSGGTDILPTDPAAPGQMAAGTAYIQIFVLTNIADDWVTTSSDYVTQVDEIAIDVFDEDEFFRTFAGINVDGTIAANKVVANSVAANAIVAGKVAANAIVAGCLAANSVSAANIIATEIVALLVRVSTLYVGFKSFSGTTTWDAPGNGDRLAYMDGTTLAFLEYTNGAWTTVKGIQIGLMLASGFLNMIGCRGLYHPQLPPGSGEVLPTPAFRVFNFENNYQDQNGVDDWASKNNLVFTTAQKKYGSYSITYDPATAGGGSCYLEYPAIADTSYPQAMAMWHRIEELADGETREVMRVYYTGANYIGLNVSRSGSAYSYGYSIYKSSTVTSGTLGTASLNTWYFIGFSYAISTNNVAFVLNNTIVNVTPAGSWAAASTGVASFWFGFNNVALGWRYKSFADELLFYPNKGISPELLAQHYTHNVAWETNHAYSDQLIFPDVANGGRVMRVSEAWTVDQMLTEVPVVDPAVGWFASKTDPFTADSFSGGLTIDFSSVVPVGTKAVRVSLRASGNVAWVYARSFNNPNISNTPNAATEYSSMLFYHNQSNGTTVQEVTLRLSADYKAQIAVSDADTNIYVPYPIAELR